MRRGIIFVGRSRARLYPLTKGVSCGAGHVDIWAQGRARANQPHAECGKSGMIVSDNGTELISKAVLAWCGKIGSIGATSRPRSRCRTATSRVSMVACHDELLNETLFLSLDHSRAVITAWAEGYNQ